MRKHWWNKFISWLETIANVRAAVIASRYGKIQEAKTLMMKK